MVCCYNRLSAAWKHAFFVRWYYTKKRHLFFIFWFTTLFWKIEKIKVLFFNLFFIFSSDTKNPAKKLQKLSDFIQFKFFV